ncbi:MAG TPA: sigma-54 dependent transcriptional regulator [Candidatus Polarisedimenticolaceae bacterium]|nr:sigma-54 dependent transcriptional regulator [Candidatus Polarisedimenticolaceae bacterium]
MSENATPIRILAALPPGHLLQACFDVLRDEAHHEVEVAGDQEHALSRVRSVDWDLVLLDFALGPDASLALLEALKAQRPATLFVMAGTGVTAATVREAFRRGAHDVLLEPVPPRELLDVACKASHLRTIGAARRRMGEELETERRRARDLEERLAQDDPFATLVTASAAMRRLVADLREVARSDATVLLTGESGTGKGLLARAIHGGSFRKTGPFVEASCVVYSEGMLNSELFGHERGAFTGAARLKRGRFELARGGTLFLDEIGEIAPATQLLLLRVLQERVFERVGGEETLEADVRLVAATNRDLDAAVRGGAFREDLFYRLNVIPLRVPALRERPDDVAVLAAHFLARASSRLGRDVPELAPGALDALTAHTWPGNVRELENLMERLVVLERRGRIEASDLPSSIRAPLPAVPDVRLADVETTHILEILAACGGNKKLAASKLGIHRSTLYAKLGKRGQ